MSEYVQSTKNVWPYYAAKNEGAAKSGSSNVMGKDEFMKILVAQMQNQDPMQPMQDREYIAQMAQFTSVEQLMNLSNDLKKFTNSLGFSASLIGKLVSWEHLNDSGSESIFRSGIVDGLSVIDGTTYAVVGNELVSLDNILAIMNTPPEQPGQDDSDDQDGGESS